MTGFPTSGGRFAHSRIARWLTHQAYAAGVISGSAWTSDPPTRGYVWGIHWRGKRPYVLWLKREKWGYPWHFIRYHHWPENVWGFCGKCGPWQCCGATGYDHAEGCDEA